MTTEVELTVDVTEAAGLGEPCQTAVTVVLPEPPEADPSEPPGADRLDAAPVTCFAFPGGGYCRRYFTFDMPGSSIAGHGGQAGWHAARGWIFVAIDHLGTGDSTLVNTDRLAYEDFARVNAATVEAVSARLAEGTLADGYPPVERGVRLGIGQSVGGCLLIVAQAHHETFDGIGVLGSSAVHTVVPTRPGTPPLLMPWMPRGSDLADPVVLNRAAMAAPAAPAGDEHPFTWAFHYDDEPADVVAEDLAAMAFDGGAPLPPWRSATFPMCAVAMTSPGTVAAEAAAITVPVFVGVGERDVVPDPWIEPKAYKSATDVSLFVCPRMAHMHNFALTRERLWNRLHAWGDGVATLADDFRNIDQS
jgi:alpha-beta hydrolase superfamily lysophospholipase